MIGNLEPKKGMPWNTRIFYPHTGEDFIADQQPHDFWPETGESFKYPIMSEGRVAINGAQIVEEALGQKPPTGS